eukprot:jgi/Picsp_1/2721/NSC_00950-R1_human viral protein homolog1
MTVRCLGTPREDPLFQGNHLHQLKRNFTATISPHSKNASDGKGVDIFTESLQRKVELELQQLSRFDEEQGQTNNGALHQADMDTLANKQIEKDGMSGDNGSTFIQDLEREVGGPKGPEPTRYGDWERGGRCSDF